jgi:hypothetical protein
MKINRTLAMTLGLCALVTMFLAPLVVYGTASQTFRITHPAKDLDMFTTSVYCSSTDAAVVVTFPRFYGCPTYIVAQQAIDNTAGQAKAAMQSGEVWNFTPTDWEAASLSSDQMTVYRTDLDGNDTIEDDVWWILTFGKLRFDVD